VADLKDPLVQRLQCGGDSDPAQHENTIDVVPTTAAWMADGEANR